MIIFLKIEVFKLYNEFPTRGSSKVKDTVLIVFIAVRIAFCGNILFSCSHIQINVTVSRIYLNGIFVLTIIDLQNITLTTNSNYSKHYTCNHVTI